MTGILIADDDPIIIESLSSALMKHGYDVFAATDGQQAVDYTRQNRPDLLILDATMPKLDGFSALRELKKDEGTAHIPVLFLTARRTAGDMLAAQAVGADGYLAKPIEMEELLERVRSLTS